MPSSFQKQVFHLEFSSVLWTCTGLQRTTRMLETSRLGQQRARWSGLENFSRDQLLAKRSVPSLLNAPR